LRSLPLKCLDRLRALARAAVRSILCGLIGWHRWGPWFVLDSGFRGRFCRRCEALQWPEDQARVWRVHSPSGQFLLGVCSHLEAMSRAGQIGAVTYVDMEHGFIFIDTEHGGPNK
jgi:hypothetical protein